MLRKHRQHKQSCGDALRPENLVGEQIEKKEGIHADSQISCSENGSLCCPSQVKEYRWNIFNAHYSLLSTYCMPRRC